MIPFGCVPCGPVGQMCLSRSTSIICGSREHKVMTYISQALLACLLLYMAVMMLLMYKAFKWQKEKPDEKMPWYVAGIGDLVCYMKGYKECDAWPEPTFTKMWAAMQGEHYTQASGTIDFFRSVTKPPEPPPEAAPPEAPRGPAEPPAQAQRRQSGAGAGAPATGGSSGEAGAPASVPADVPANLPADAGEAPAGATAENGRGAKKKKMGENGASGGPHADDESSLGSLDNEALRLMGIDVHVADDQISLASHDHRNLAELGVSVKDMRANNNVRFNKEEEAEEEEEEEEEEEDDTENFLAFSYMIWGIFICCDLPLQYFATIFGDQAELALFSQALVFGLQCVLVAFFKPFDPDGVNAFCVVATFFVFLMAMSTAFTELFRKYTFTEAGKAYSHLVEPLDFVSSLWMMCLIGWYLLLTGGKLFVEIYMYATKQDLSHVTGEDDEKA